MSWVLRRLKRVYLFNLVGEIALPGHQLLQEDQVYRIERVLDEPRRRKLP